MKAYAGINIQWPISQNILTGQKTVETRTYPLPKKYIGKDLLLIETPGPNGEFKARITGIIRFTSSFQYKNKHEFYQDVGKHLVTPGSPWEWKGKAKWGWQVEVVKVFQTPKSPPAKKGIVFTTNIKV